MALELNGTTGVSLVQDGVVTAADLSSTLDLSGKTVTLPAGVGGKVLQVQYLQSSNVSEISTTSNTLTASGLQLSITPTATNNKIVVRLLINMSEATTASNAFAGQMYVNGSAWDMGSGVGSYSLGYTAPSNYSPIVFGGVWTAANTNQITFEPYYRSTVNGSFVKLAHNGSSYYFEAIEVAA